MVSKRPKQWAVKSNKVGRYLNFYTLRAELDKNHSLLFKWTGEENLWSKLIGIGSFLILFLFQILIVLPICIDKKNLRIDEILAGGVLASMIFIFSSVHLVVVIDREPIGNLCIQVFDLEKKYDLLDKEFGLKRVSSPLLEFVICSITVIPLLAMATVALPTFLIFFASSYSPFRGIVAFYEIKIFELMDVLEIAWSNESKKLFIFLLEVFLCLILWGIGFGASTFSCIYMIQIALLYVGTTKDRLKQLQESVYKTNNDLITRAYTEYEVVNLIVNTTTSGLIALFYFSAMILITVISFVMLRIDLNFMCIFAFWSVDITLILMLVFYISGSVRIRLDSNAFRLKYKYMEKSRGTWNYKFWTARKNYKVWIGNYFTLEENSPFDNKTPVI